MEQFNLDSGSAHGGCRNDAGNGPDGLGSAVLAAQARAARAEALCERAEEQGWLLASEGTAQSCALLRALWCAEAEVVSAFYRAAGDAAALRLMSQAALEPPRRREKQAGFDAELDGLDSDHPRLMPGVPERPVGWVARRMFIPACWRKSHRLDER